MVGSSGRLFDPADTSSTRLQKPVERARGVGVAIPSHEIEAITKRVAESLGAMT